MGGGVSIKPLTTPANQSYLPLLSLNLSLLLTYEVRNDDPVASLCEAGDHMPIKISSSKTPECSDRNETIISKEGRAFLLLLTGPRPPPPHHKKE
jgi:hypothetical protein